MIWVLCSRLAEAWWVDHAVAENMNEYETSDEHGPVTWLRGYPIYAAHFLVLVFIVSMLVTTAVMAFNGAALLSWLTYSSGEVLHGEVWRIFTYGLVNPPSPFFVMNMFMFIWFGRELEKTFGRRLFFLLYGGIYFLTPVLFTLLGLWVPMSAAGEPGGFALFIAFATLYPNVALFFGILAKWLAFILVAIYTLMCLAYHSWTSLISLWATTGFAFAFVRYQQGLITLPRLNLFRRGPKLRVLPDLKPEKTPAAKAERSASSMAEVDALLDKIVQSGISSLTAKERAKLDAARTDLLKKDSGRR